MKTFLCEEMMCGHCVSRIENGLKEAGIAHSVNLEEKTVSIQEDFQIEDAIDVLDDLGFSAKELA